MWKDDWKVELENIEIETTALNGWTKCTLYRHRFRTEHVCIWFDGGYLEGDNENFPYKCDRNSMTLHDTDGDVIEYRRSVIL